MFHYVYLLEFENGMGYICLHSTVILPELDTCYLGSGKKLPPRCPKTCTKHILKVFNTREEARAYEIELIEVNNCVDSDLWYNVRKSSHDKHGSSLSEEHKELISKTHKGRKRPEYAKKYKGEGRTPAQKAGSIASGLKLRGTKCPAKGSPGTNNSGFSPWYYITPEGAYVEVHDVPKQDYAERLGFTARQLGHRFHYTNEHQESNRYPFKGWTFGNLPRP